MADKKITALTENTQLVAADLFHIVDDPASSPSNQKITVANIFNKVPTFLGLNSVETLTDTAPSVSVSTAVSLLDGTSNQVAATLADVTTVGQVKIIVCANVTSGSNSVSLTTTHGAGNTITFDTVGQSVTLMWIGSAWAVIATGDNAVATKDTGVAISAV